MNREPNPHKIKPLRDKCNACGEIYKLTGENAYGIDYPKKPECRHLMCKCTECENVTIIFIPQESNSFEVAEATGIPIHPLEWPSDDIYESWVYVMGIELPVSKPLTERQEKIVDYLTYLLDTDKMTIEDFHSDGEVLI